MKKIFFVILALTSPCFAEPKLAILANPVGSYEGKIDDTSDVMVPIPMKDRVFNKTGHQCAWATLETCGRFAKEQKLIGLTEYDDCKIMTKKIGITNKLDSLKVKYEQSFSKRDRSLIIKSVVVEGRGCLFDVPDHCMTLVHYDEEAGLVKYINNSDPKLKIRTWSMREFNYYWQGWVCVVYPDHDIFPKKHEFIQIIDRNSFQGEYTTDYIIKPNK